MKQFKCSMGKKIESLVKKNERVTTQIETYVGFDELLGYADAEYLLEDVVDVLSKYYTYEDETFNEDQAADDPEFIIKVEHEDERSDFYSEDIFYIHLPNAGAAEDLAYVLDGKVSESCKKRESHTLKQKELKDMARYGEAEDITTISSAAAEELKKKGIETLGISYGVYGMNGALLQDSDGNKYVITARSSNLFYFV